MAKRLPPDPAPRAKRTDAQRNYEQIVAVARVVVAEQGTNASLRDVARRADVGLGTLYRHFPTREALLEVLLRRSFDELADEAHRLEATQPPLEALDAWLRRLVAANTAFRGMAGSMMATLKDDSSPLQAACAAMRASGERLLRRAQADHHVRSDVDGTDVLALAYALAWIGEQAPPLAARTDHLISLVIDALRPPPTSAVRQSRKGPRAPPRRAPRKIG
jgi:AcrR family transcriptional regulator